LIAEVMILGIMISDLASSFFSKLQLWRPVVSGLTEATDYDLRFVGQIRSQNDPVILSPTILGPTLEKISEQYSAFRTGLSDPSRSGGSPLRPIANGYLTFGFPRYLPDPQKTVFSICDLNHWIRPDSFSEADRLEAQASILGAMREARGFLFWSADLLNQFERVFPHWLADERKPYRLINVPSTNRMPPVTVLQGVKAEQLWVRAFSAARIPLVIWRELSKNFAAI
jgi:hypothetical protein